jgi:hypothetical protein
LNCAPPPSPCGPANDLHFDTITSDWDYLKELTAAHVEATSCLIHKHFQHLLPLLKFSSNFLEDLQEVLSSGSDLIYLFRGTYPGAHGRKIDSQTDHNLRHGIGEPNMRRLYQDLFAFETECTEEFSHAGGDDTFRNVSKAVQELPEWLRCVRLSDEMFQHSLKLITASGKHCISALLSQPVKKCLTIAEVALQASQFVFTNHASALRGGGDHQGTVPQQLSALKRDIHFSECKNLRVQAQVIRGSCTTEEAAHMLTQP